jgi:hypothetical protein
VALAGTALLVLVVLEVEEQEHLAYLLLVALEQLIQEVEAVAVVVKAHQTLGLLAEALGVQVLSFFVTPIPFRLQHLLPVLQP